MCVALERWHPNLMACEDRCDDEENGWWNEHGSWHFFAFEALEMDVGPLHGVTKRGFAWICAAVNRREKSKQNCDGYVRGFV